MISFILADILLLLFWATMVANFIMFVTVSKAATVSRKDFKKLWETERILRISLLLSPNMTEDYPRDIYIKRTGKLIQHGIMFLAISLSSTLWLIVNIKESVSASDNLALMNYVCLLIVWIISILWSILYTRKVFYQQ